MTTPTSMVLTNRVLWLMEENIFEKKFVFQIKYLIVIKEIYLRLDSLVTSSLHVKMGRSVTILWPCVTERPSEWEYVSAAVTWPSQTQLVMANSLLPDIPVLPASSFTSLRKTTVLGESAPPPPNGENTVYSNLCYFIKLSLSLCHKFYHSSYFLP